ncbi:hypothetical protein ABT340_20150 [Streptosporangium sp. NPDC000239]|uniref:hypothetical protein n=1 Tax=Streptosporangium sp. NPDC000239 TaxID=3154248 RepID=UPI0033294C9E
MATTPPDRASTTFTSAISAASLIASIIAIIVSVKSCAVSQEATDITKRESQRRALLELSQAISHFGSSEGQESKGDQKPLADISVRNRGSGEALITSISAEVTRSQFLDSCWPSEGGGLTAKETYTLNIPVARTPPFSVTKELNPPFRVKPGENDRFVVAVGPAPDDAQISPWIGMVTLRLNDIDGNDVRVGPFALVSAGSSRHLRFAGRNWVFDKPEDLACVRDNVRVIKGLLATPGVVASVELKSLLRAFTRYKR